MHFQTQFLGDGQQKNVPFHYYNTLNARCIRKTTHYYRIQNISEYRDRLELDYTYILYTYIYGMRYRQLQSRIYEFPGYTKTTILLKTDKFVAQNYQKHHHNVD